MMFRIVGEVLVLYMYKRGRLLLDGSEIFTAVRPSSNLSAFFSFFFFQVSRLYETLGVMTDLSAILIEGGLYHVQS